MTEFQQAFLKHLPTPLEQTTLGAAFKAMIEYQRDQKYDWAKTDDLMFDIAIENDDPESAGGFFGMFGLQKPGKPHLVLISLSRVLDAQNFTEEDLDEDDLDEDDLDENELDQAEEVSLGFQFEIAALGDIDPEEFDGFYEDSDEHESLEEFVKAILENEVFAKLALQKPQSVEFLTKNEF